MGRGPGAWIVAISTSTVCNGSFFFACGANPGTLGSNNATSYCNVLFLKRWKSSSRRSLNNRTQKREGENTHEESE